jgi:hypothetical protein
MATELVPILAAGNNPISDLSQRELSQLLSLEKVVLWVDRRKVILQIPSLSEQPIILGQKRFTG